MGVCIFGMGDCGGSETKTLIENNVLKRNVMDILQKHSTSVNNTVQMNQTIVIKAKLIKCPSLKVTNRIKADLRFISQVTDQLKVDLQTVFKEAIKNNAIATTKEEKDFLAAPSNSSTVTEIKNRLTDIIEKSITMESIASITNKFDISQNTVIETDIIESDLCEFTNDMVITIMANSILKNVSDAISNDTIINDIVGDASADSDSKSKGLNSIVDSVMSFLSTAVLGYMGMVVAIIGAIILLLYFSSKLLFGGGGNSSAYQPQYQQQYQTQYPDQQQYQQYPDQSAYVQTQQEQPAQQVAQSAAQPVTQTIAPEAQQSQQVVPELAQSLPAQPLPVQVIQPTQA